MDKIYNNKEVEEKIYKQWEEKGYFKPEINPNGKPYCIMLPLPNANGSLHLGHGMFTVEDILIRYHRMLGDSTLWFPGTDHAGIETQFVFEKKLRAEGKSRLDFDQETLYKMIWDYVEENRGTIEKQLRKLGLSLDWSREKYPLNPEIVELVYKTFKKLFDDGYAYRGKRLVNYCTFDGTGFSDLEVVSEERDGNLYFIKYPIKGGGFITVATTRPETMFGDTAVMVNAKDKRYKDLIGKTIVLPFLEREIPIITDELVDMQFGTGAVKVTPAHDFNDFEVGKRHNLASEQVIGFDGKLINTKIVDGLYANQAREKVVELLKEKELLEKIEPHKLVVKVCYKCKHVLEPLPLEQWFIKVDELKQKAIKVVKEGEIKIFPKSFEKIYFQWMENLRDWNVSRQIVWGIRIPAWKNTKTGEWAVTDGKAPEGENWEQDKDTFDTWFSSGQWPFVTLKTSQPGDFTKFYPTEVLETAADILKAWVSRMIMLGLYMTGEVPFKHVLLHGMITDPLGKKMSKSKGNVINPLELIDQYGADSVRFALIYGNATGSDQALSYPKLEAARKFCNKLWNMARFIEFSREELKIQKDRTVLPQTPGWSDNWSKKVKTLADEITKYIELYQFNYATDRLYEFTWHEFADSYIENIKVRMTMDSLKTLEDNFMVILKLLHPFMPFITEEINNTLYGGENNLIISQWPSFA
jgi:valyl-tRNA synthetase